MTKRQHSSCALLQEAPLRELIAAHAVNGLIAVGQSGGFVLQVRLGDGMAVLASSRGEPRAFASLSTLASLMKRLGAPHFEVDASEFTPGRVRAAQPERSAAMKAGNLPRAKNKSSGPATRTKK